MKKLFGTDGIRGIANREPITAEMIFHIGRAGAYLFKDKADPKILIGKDTRISGDMLSCFNSRDMFSGCKCTKSGNCTHSRSGLPNQSLSC